MLKGFCQKKSVLIADKKLIEWCLKCECVWLRWQIWRVEKRLRHYGRKNDIEISERR